MDCGAPGRKREENAYGNQEVSVPLSVGLGTLCACLLYTSVVDSNKAALHLYEKLGFTHLGVIPGGFWDKTGAYQDIHLFYIQTP